MLHLLNLTNTIHLNSDIKISLKEFLLWLSGLRTQCCLCEDAGSIPGFAQGVKDSTSPQVVAQVEDVAWIRCCHGCATGPSCSSNSTPSLGTSIHHGCDHKKKKKKKKKRFHLKTQDLESPSWLSG